MIICPKCKKAMIKIGKTYWCRSCDYEVNAESEEKTHNE
jgi:DNA-directed RNA polymerase subunit M/transcription elongation factor TFIIS